MESSRSLVCQEKCLWTEVSQPLTKRPSRGEVFEILAKNKDLLIELMNTSPSGTLEGGDTNVDLHRRS